MGTKAWPATKYNIQDNYCVYLLHQMQVFAQKAIALSGEVFKCFSNSLKCTICSYREILLKEYLNLSKFLSHQIPYSRKCIDKIQHVDFNTC